MSLRGDRVTLRRTFHQEAWSASPALSGDGREEEEKRGGSFSHRVAHGRLQGGVLLGLTADVIEGEEQVVVVGEVGRNLHLYLLVELRGPAEMERGD